MGWYDRNPERWRTEREVARKLLFCARPGVDPRGTAFITGHLSVLSRHGHEYGPFNIRVTYPDRFPDAGLVPSVYLYSHRDRWRNGFDSHIEPDWRLCLFVPGESGIDFAREDSLGELLAVTASFLRKEVIYQRDLAAKVAEGPPAVWPGEARSHGTEGIVEAVRARGSIRVTEPCPCGSGIAYRDCHLSVVQGAHLSGTARPKRPRLGGGNRSRNRRMA
ncbi:SEC-C domain-containing protein [Tautonia plasticadhaerens]|uniref:SEC-C motif protein n=1 Tax=Tautonia plasticadhaerens TaxID=2527974 RepID=A0A518HEK1_9BACT|nr:SEC-C domain-containing protein [Tautonia plasticadhaerens]QDV39273.1 hypothetical protein ElP_72370 [Tautonia plasticadhaerens]